MAQFFKTLYREIGLQTLLSSPLDAKLLCLQRFVRLFAYGGSTLVLALYLSSLGNTDQRIGLFMSLTLWGDVVISLFLTVVADALGRRRMLALGSLLMSASGVVFAISGNYWVLVLASVLGVISPRSVQVFYRLFCCTHFICLDGRSLDGIQAYEERERERNMQTTATKMFTDISSS